MVHYAQSGQPSHCIWWLAAVFGKAFRESKVVWGVMVTQKALSFVSTAIATAVNISAIALFSQVTGLATPSLAQAPPPPYFQAAPAIRYRVLVDLTDAQSLQRVRQIEPGAFIQNFSDGRTRIQAGAFVTEASARERLDALARVGIPATAYNDAGQPVSTTNPANPGGNPAGNPGGNPTPYPPGSNPGSTPTAVSQMPKGYYAIVPIDRDQIGVTFEAIRKLGVPESYIIIGKELYGWHIAVGVYPDRGSAEKMSQFLRSKGGFDARAYFQR
jgi:hypothetical protein